MNIRVRFEKNILKVAQRVLQPTTFDRLLIERRRRVNKVTRYYPEAVFFSKGKSNKKYCVVRYIWPDFGLMAAGIQYVFCYHQLLKRGYIPLIDIEYEYSYEKGRLGESNIWDLCFEQSIPVQEVESEAYVLATGWLFSYSDDPEVCLGINDDVKDHFIHVRRENFREYYKKAKKYVEPIWRIKPELIEELEKIWDKVKRHRVLGVSLREDFGTDVNIQSDADKEVLKKHPLLPSVKETIEIIKNELESWEYDFIFLSTLYEDTLNLFRDEFGDRVICINRKRLNFAKPIELWKAGKKELYEDGMTKQDENAEMTKAYLKEIVALSRCNYLVGGHNSGMVAALVMNGGEYEDIYILQDARKIHRY